MTFAEWLASCKKVFGLYGQSAGSTIGEPNMQIPQIVEVLDTIQSAAMVRLVQSVVLDSRYVGNGPAGPEYYPWPVIKRKIAQINVHYWGA